MRTRHFEVMHTCDTDLYTIDLHHHDFYEIYYFISGQVEYRVEGKTFSLAPGDLLLISPWEFHQPIVQPGVPYERRVLWIDRSYITQFNSGDCSLVSCFDPAISNLIRPSKPQQAVIGSLLEQMMQESASSHFGASLYAQGLFLQLMVEINRMAKRTVHDKKPGEGDELVSQVLSFISAHYAEKLTLQMLADTFYVSKYYLSHEFSRKVGTSIYRYVLLRRLLSARELISGGLSPSEACIRCGFSDYANFYRLFKAEYGLSPRDFAAQSL